MKLKPGVTIEIGIMAIVLLMPNIAFASDNEPREVFSQEERESGLYDENGYVVSKQDRLAINPDFAPDASCLFDVFQIQCIPGSEQECSKPQFGNNEENTCFPKTLVDGEWEWICPEGYHNVDADETGQCYPNEEGCQKDISLKKPKKKNDSDSCRELQTVCYDDEYREHEECIEYCNENPERKVCKQDVN